MINHIITSIFQTDFFVAHYCQLPCLILNSDPTKADSDGDNWSDPYEINVSKTDPMQDDTDGDGAIDSRDCKPLVYSDILYNREAAYDYSQKYAYDFNSNYEAIEDNDCANFVSQCIHAGGLEMSTNWYMIKMDLLEAIGYHLFEPISFTEHANLSFKWTHTWTDASRHYHYFKDNYGIKTYKIYRGDSISDFIKNHQDIKVGDLLYFHNQKKSDIDVTHSTIISDIDEKDIYFAGHTSPAEHASLDKKIVDTNDDGSYRYDYAYIIQMSDAL